MNVNVMMENDTKLPAYSQGLFRHNNNLKSNLLEIKEKMKKIIYLRKKKII